MNVKESLLKALAGANGKYVSGSRLANSIGVSRNAVWKAVKSLETDGFTIDSAVNKGYRISPDNNKLCPELIYAELNTAALGREIIIPDEVDSTNNMAKSLAADGAPHGTTVVADSQSAGRGRLGRNFVSPKGTGLYMTVIIRPDISLELSQLITSCAAVASAEAVEALCGSDVCVKWVNDLYMNGKKICGILTEASLSLETKSLDYAVIGIGVNVRSSKDVFENNGLSEIASSIEDESGVKVNRCRLCSEILNRLEIRLNNIADRSFLNEYRRREILTGNTITAESGGRIITGTAAAIDDNANLIIRLSDGSEVSLGSGEANLCRIKK